MTIEKIQVTAARTFKHPHESYSNLRPSVLLMASVAPDEDVNKCVKQLQQQAEGLVEDHKQGLIKSLEELWQLTERQAEVRGLESQLKRAQSRLDEIRAENPSLALIGNGGES